MASVPFRIISLLLLIYFTRVLGAPVLVDKCPSYGRHAMQRHEENRSTGDMNCHSRGQRQNAGLITRRKWRMPLNDCVIRLRIRTLYIHRLFENAFPNTLDTMVKWKGFAWKDGKRATFTDEDLAFVITGDM